MKIIATTSLILFISINVLVAATAPPAPPGFRVTFKSAHKRGAEMLITKTTTRVKRTWVMPTGTFTTSSLTSRFSPASTADSTLRPLTVNYTSNGDGTVTVCVETVQNAGETIAFQYSQNLISWSAGRPLEPDPSGARRVAFCFSDHATNLPAQLFFRVMSL